MSEHRANRGLKRQIGPVALLFTGITGIVGSGWLFASLYAAQLAGPAAISYAGNYGNGLGLLPHGSDMALVAVLSLGVFRLAVETRLPAARTRALIAATPP